jgi:hypothetical protein
MNHRTLVLFAAMLSGTGSLSACETCSADPSNASEPFDLGIDTDLRAVIRLDTWVSDSRHYEWLAVGASGTVVAWGYDSSGIGYEPVIDVFDLGDEDLRAAWVDGQTWWVVGDGGLVMASDNLGVSWEQVELQTDADLYGIDGFAGRPIVVGDEVIAIRTLDGTWELLEPPAGGWGLLRGISAVGTRVDAVGLGGVIWSTSDPSSTWTLEPNIVSVDLFAVYNGVAVGAQGTLLSRGFDSGWSHEDTGVDVDLVDIGNGYILGQNGEIYSISSNPLQLIDTDPGARGVDGDFSNGWATVGDGGSASSPPPRDCNY